MAMVGGMGPVPERVVAVLSDGGQGSGYRLSDFLVLTAAHVVGDAAREVRVVAPKGGDPQPCTVAWRRSTPDCDVALLRVEAPLPTAGPEAPWHRPQWGEVPGTHPVPACEVIGYPQVRRDGRGRLESEQFIGTLKPGSGLLSGRYVLDNDHAAPAPRSDGRSPWAGLSGSAVFAYGLLVAVVSTDVGGWRHSRVSATPISHLLDDISFRRALELHGCPTPELRLAQPNADFERRYAAYVTRKHRGLTIYGVDLNHEREWPLDTSYLSLEATFALGAGTAERARPPGRPGSLRPRDSALPADQALSGRDRVLLRGVAGSGKTTLVQWLAVTAASGGAATGELAYLRGRVPFVLPLRTLARDGRGLPGPERFLSAMGCPIASAQPEGWVDGVLAQGRGVLLVDGIDEVTEQDREHTRRWLHELIDVYPGNLWLVTSRPSAVRDNWLVRDDFTELMLAPMRRDEVTAFVRRWHAATDADASLEHALLAALSTKQDLTRLATNPLMCALICALHRDRRGYLPHGRKELYDAALSMLLERRDHEKGIRVSGAPGAQLTKEPQIRLLQKLAHWMIRNECAEIDSDRAERIIAEALPSVPQLEALGDAGTVLRHLLLRSGLLREPAPDRIDFVHRTFQDFLAAKAAVEQGDLPMLVNNAAKTQWEDVIRMAVAHARPGECARLLRDLIALGDRDNDRRVYLLAMACLENAAELERPVRELVEERAARVIPPRSFDEVGALIKIGRMVLELLPPDLTNVTEWEAGYLLETAAGIARDTDLHVLARFCRLPWPRVRERVIDGWRAFDTAHYAREVIRHLPPDDAVIVRDPEQLTAVSGIGGWPRLHVRGHVPASTLTASAGHDATHDLQISGNPSLVDLDFLRAWPGLRHLTVTHCPQLSSVTGLTALTGLEELSTDVPQLPACTAFLPPGAPLRQLSLPRAVSPRGWLRGLDRWPTLRWLELGTGNSPVDADDWRAIRSLPGLECLMVAASALLSVPRELAAAEPRRLALVGELPSDRVLASLPRHFPHLTMLDLSETQTDGRPLDLVLLSRLDRLTQLFVLRKTALTGLDWATDLEIVEVG